MALLAESDRDRFFSQVAPLWPIVDRDEMSVTPYAPPMLLRAICLVSASLEGTDGADLVEDIIASVRQCFDTYEMLALPSAPTLKACLLLLLCPKISNTSPILTSACRMALLLGYHLSGTENIHVYRACIIAARWYKFNDPNVAQANHTYFILSNIRPHAQLDDGSFMSELDKVLRNNSTFPVGSTRFGEGEKRPMHSSEDGNMALCRLVESYMRADEELVRDVGQQLLRAQHFALHLNPFHHIMRQISAGIIAHPPATV